MDMSTTVANVALSPDQAVVLRPNDLFRTAVEAMSARRLGIACIVDEMNTLIGVFTDGDIRRLLLKEHKPMAALFAEDISAYVTRNPKTVSGDMALVDAVSMMESADVYDLPVVDGAGHLVGLLHMHTALRYILGI